MTHFSVISSKKKTELGWKFFVLIDQRMCLIFFQKLMKTGSTARTPSAPSAEKFPEVGGAGKHLEYSEKVLSHIFSRENEMSGGIFNASDILVNVMLAPPRGSTFCLFRVTGAPFRTTFMPFPGEDFGPRVPISHRLFSRLFCHSWDKSFRRLIDYAFTPSAHTAYARLWKQNEMRK